MRFTLTKLRFTLTNPRFTNVNRYAAKPYTCMKRNEAFLLDIGFWHNTGNRAYSLSRVLPQLGKRIHTVKGNVYRVVEN